MRLKFVLAIDYNDFTSTVVNFAIFGALEPLLAIISACLPVLQPVLAKFSNSSAFSWSRKNTGYRKRSSLASRDRTAFGPNPTIGCTQRSAFERLDDNFVPLVDSKVGAGQGRALGTPYSGDGKNHITVTREWDVS